MVAPREKRPIRLGFGMQYFAVTALAASLLVWQLSKVQHFADLWFTHDQQARYAFEARDYKQAVELFEDPSWKGVAAYYAGSYEIAADIFSRIATAEGFFNRGDALMNNRDYRNAIRSFELAVDAEPGWVEARENLELARYTLDYIERAREQSDTGDESEQSADDFTFDNDEERGKEIEITRESTIGIDSADKWMRSVDTQTRDFLRTRFLLEARGDQAP